jgi:hypothetical protein
LRSFVYSPCVAPYAAHHLRLGASRSLECCPVSLDSSSWLHQRSAFVGHHAQISPAILLLDLRSALQSSTQLSRLLSHLRLKEGHSRWEEEGNVDVPTREREVLRDQDHMSQRPTASDPQSSSTLDARSSVLSNSQCPKPKAPGTYCRVIVCCWTWHRTRLYRSRVLFAIAAAGLGAARGSVEQRPSRSFGVHSILNPTQVDTSPTVQDQVETPSDSVPRHQPQRLYRDMYQASRHVQPMGNLRLGNCHSGIYVRNAYAKPGT